MPEAAFLLRFHGERMCLTLAPIWRSAVSPGDSVTSISYEGSLLWTLEEIAKLISGSGDASETLTNIVHLIQHRFGTDVCSVYLLEPDRANLVLAATIGLKPESVGRVRMRLSVRVSRDWWPSRCGRRSSPMPRRIPRFKYFPEAGEEPYRSFLGVPDRRSRTAARRPGRADDRGSRLRTPTTCAC